MGRLNPRGVLQKCHPISNLDGQGKEVSFNPWSYSRPYYSLLWKLDVLGKCRADFEIANGFAGKNIGILWAFKLHEEE